MTMKTNQYNQLSIVVASAMLGMFLNSAIAVESGGGQPESGSPPLARKIPGITAPDQFPGGCVDCHKNYPEMKLDVRISTLMQGWTNGVEATFLEKMQPLAPAGLQLKGRHPAVSAAMLEDIPGSCLKCHGESAKKAPALGQMMHVIHLGGVKDGHFLSIFQGECTHCHKLDSATGMWRTPGGREHPVETKGGKDKVRATSDAAGSAAARGGGDAIRANLFPLLLILITGAAVSACFATVSCCQDFGGDDAGCKSPQ